MVDRRATVALGLLACALVALPAASQVPDQRTEGGRRHGSLGQNQPNPFSQETTIPFTVGDAACVPGTQRHVVTVRIYNILSQVVAVATLMDSAATDYAANQGASRPLSNLALGCGSYGARWDGKHAQDGRQAAPGVYMYQLLIDGHPAGMRKMLKR